MPSIDTGWMDANSQDLTMITESTIHNTGLNTGDLELTGKYKEGPTWYYPDIYQTDGTNTITFESDTKLLSISGIIKVSSLIISDDITYEGTGTIYVTGDVLIDGNVLPSAPGSYPTTNVLGVIAGGNTTLGDDSSQLKLTGAYYCAGTVTSSKQTELAGTMVCQNFSITAQVPKIWQVPSLALNLPPGMPGATPFWVFTELTWREVFEGE